MNTEKLSANWQCWSKSSDLSFYWAVSSINIFLFVFPSRWNLGSKVEWKIIPTSQCSILLHIQSLKEKKKKKRNTTPWYWLQTPRKNYQGQKFSLSLSHFKRAQLSCHSFSYDEKWKEKNSRNFRGLQTQRRGKIVRSSHDHGLVL